ncbi:very low-density lipoprotein receptor-like [Anastrepha obliqua]|uniref:very low-density lipoprotein receptor-like n=1 Tax=Anastrepha obliqua TaxID=95512 RepID=UPI00240A3E83|nr:very low-density lipoprotein receptor-like [Anastrepha obliqua]
MIEHFKYLLCALLAIFHVSAALATNSTWACTNKEIIPRNKLCDGYADCSNGRDESVKVCLSNACKDDEFRCAYGACIRAELKCNNQIDCFDRSDEMELLCASDNEIWAKLQGNWWIKQDNPYTRNPNDLSCESGKFIAQELFCEGKADGDDVSDETEAYCSLKKCKPTQSPCRYGGCIDTNKFCNEEIDCIDRSDENEFFAKCPHHNSSSEVEYKPSTSPCNILDDPNLEIYNENEQVYSKPGYFDNETRIILTYKNNYTIAANTPKVVRICGQQGWNDVIPKCFSREYEGYFSCNNGDVVRDCSDGSDEFIENNVIESPCLNAENPNDLSCESGKFIAQELFCDGKADGDDVSDETEAYCSLKKCKPTQSPCRYGGCIDTNKFCNEEIDCIDRSDENEFFAKCPHHNSSSEVEYKPSTSPCNILDDPNLEIYNENEQVYSKPGYFDNETRIILTYKNNYTIAANTPKVVRICGQQGWNDVIPKCFSREC